MDWLYIITVGTLTHLEGATLHRNHRELHVVHLVGKHRFLTGDKVVVDGYHVGGVNIVVAVDIGMITGNAGGLALNDVAIDRHNVGGVDFSVIVHVAAANPLSPHTEAERQCGKENE